ncbi:MAG: hypothetical protein J6S14_13205 [Clostridia bacterium]|nr:hypothetical protein [Clostridia bacterium]
MNEEKRFYTTTDIQALYSCGERKAQQIVREIALMHGGKLSLGRGKVLPRELADWERGYVAS